MKILAVADLHGDHELYRWLVKVSDKMAPDVVVLAGDLLDCPEGYDSVEAGQRVDADAILDILAPMNSPVFYIMGNDDLIELESKHQGIRSIHNRKINLGEFGFVGYQYSLPFMGGVFEKPEEGIRDDLKSIESLVDQNTILVTHSPAYGILDIGVLDVSAGSRGIKELIETRHPLLHIHGHIHRDFGNEGIHFNVAAGGHRRAVLIDSSSLHGRVIVDQPG